MLGYSSQALRVLGSNLDFLIYHENDTKKNFWESFKGKWVKSDLK